MWVGVMGGGRNHQRQVQNLENGVSKEPDYYLVYQACMQLQTKGVPFSPKGGSNFN